MTEPIGDGEPAPAAAGYRAKVLAATTFLFNPALFIFFVAFAIIAFTRAVRFRQRTGRNPWGIHPVLWLLAGLFFGLIGSILCLIAVATTRPVPGGPYNAPRGPQPGYPGYPAAPPGGFPPGPPGGAPYAAPPVPAGWMPDPSGRHQLRYWSGAGWTEHVSTNGVQATDVIAGMRPYPGAPSA